LYGGTVQSGSVLFEGVDGGKDSDPDVLVSYVPTTSTEYLNIDFTDFSCLTFTCIEKGFPPLPSRLHNLAEDKP